jgi:hypothetical protein
MAAALLELDLLELEAKPELIESSLSLPEQAKSASAAQAARMIFFIVISPYP